MVEISHSNVLYKKHIKGNGSGSTVHGLFWNLWPGGRTLEVVGSISHSGEEEEEEEESAVLGP